MTQQPTEEKTPRDEFAMAALYTLRREGKINLPVDAVIACEYADAMMEARKK